MATQLTTSVMAVGQSLFSSSATAFHTLGEKVHSTDGRSFRYVKAGASALVQGKLQQASAETTAHQNLTSAAAAIGATSTVTSAITTTADQYKDGYLVVTVTPGEGYSYRISNNTVGTSAACTITLSDPILVALTTASRYDLVANPYSAVIVNPTTLTSTPIGVAVYPIVANQFGWLQTSGVAPVLADGANAVGSNLVASNGVAGAVEDAAAPGAQPFVGTAVTGAADTEYGAVLLNLQ